IAHPRREAELPWVERIHSSITQRPKEQKAFEEFRSRRTTSAEDGWQVVVPGEWGKALIGSFGGFI
ncbi:MAG: hypothetical protein VW876_14205, partial [Deltaproteobacteria bacterium]